MEYYNHEQYMQYINGKYSKSNLFYKKRFTDNDNSELFLT